MPCEVDPAPRSVDDVIERLTEIDATLPRTDGVACFNRMYLLVTILVRDHLVDGFFADPAAMSALDVTFADLYLAAVDAAEAGQRVPKAWRPLFALSGTPGHRRHDPRAALGPAPAESATHRTRADDPHGHHAAHPVG